MTYFSLYCFLRRIDYFSTENVYIPGMILTCNLNSACFNLNSFIIHYSVSESECLFCLMVNLFLVLLISLGVYVILVGLYICGRFFSLDYC